MPGLTPSLNCPHCGSGRLRRSRYQPGDGLWRSMFYSAFRCRSCGQRSHHLTSGLLFSLASAAALALAFSAGFAFSELVDDDSAPEAPAGMDSASVPVAADREAGNGSAEATVDLALVAAAEEGDPRAQLRLGRTLVSGYGAQRNSAAGLDWIERAAEQGYAEAQYALGELHLAGRNALQSFPLAFEWFERAAQQNHAEAQYRLGMMYRNGQAVAVDKPRAYLWFNVAAAQGHEQARDARDSLLPALTPEQVVAAQRAAQEWRPKPSAQ